MVYPGTCDPCKKHRSEMAKTQWAPSYKAATARLDANPVNAGYGDHGKDHSTPRPTHKVFKTSRATTRMAQLQQARKGQ